MTALWNPRVVLDVDPHGPRFSCVGEVTKDARCGQSYFSGGDISEASKILNSISRMDPLSSAVRSSLPELAALTLCKRWHRKPEYSQVTDMERKWVRLIERYCAEDAAATAPTPSLNTSSTRTLRQSPSTVVEEVHASSAALRPSNTRRATVVDVGRTSPASPDMTAPSLVRASNTITPLSTPPSTRASNTTSPLSTPPSTRASNTAPHLPTPPSTRASNTTTPLPTPPTTPGSRNHHPTPAHGTSSVSPVTPCSHVVRRRAIIEDCAVCYEPICCVDDAVWCRAQCGQNLHRSCFLTWKNKSLGNTRMDNGGVLPDRERLSAVRCVFCRSPWKWEWEQ